MHARFRNDGEHLKLQLQSQVCLLDGTSVAEGNDAGSDNRIALHGRVAKGSRGGILPQVPHFEGVPILTPPPQQWLLTQVATWRNVREEFLGEGKSHSALQKALDCRRSLKGTSNFHRHWKCFFKVSRKCSEAWGGCVQLPPHMFQPPNASRGCSGHLGSTPLWEQSH